ncbi:hypothetical protein, partial [Burkholderia cepacia]|uniref:hypothetical protein n=1 Tax=Burkholderia cepacia TaxID=292 RepID=UPI0012D49A75
MGGTISGSAFSREFPSSYYKGGEGRAGFEGLFNGVSSVVEKSIKATMTPSTSVNDVFRSDVTSVKSADQKLAENGRGGHQSSIMSKESASKILKELGVDPESFGCGDRLHEKLQNKLVETALGKAETRVGKKNDLLTERMRNSPVARAQLETFATTVTCLKMFLAESASGSNAAESADRKLDGLMARYADLAVRNPKAFGPTHTHDSSAVKGGRDRENLEQKLNEIMSDFKPKDVQKFVCDKVLDPIRTLTYGEQKESMWQVVMQQKNEPHLRSFGSAFDAEKGYLEHGLNVVQLLQICHELNTRAPDSLIPKQTKPDNKVPDRDAGPVINITIGDISFDSHDVHVNVNVGQDVQAAPAEPVLTPVEIVTARASEVLPGEPWEEAFELTSITQPKADILRYRKRSPASEPKPVQPRYAE